VDGVLLCVLLDTRRVLLLPAHHWKGASMLNTQRKKNFRDEKRETARDCPSYSAQLLPQSQFYIWAYYVPDLVPSILQVYITHALTQSMKNAIPLVLLLMRALRRSSLFRRVK
jgi:hypothetical protein